MGALLARESSENTSRSAIDNIPVELQLACLARVPHKDLREGVTCTCKTWRSLVASDAFRKTREAAGFVEWAVFAGAIYGANCYLITASGAYKTAPRPTVRTRFTMRLTGASGDMVAVLQPDDGPNDETIGTMRAHVYDPRRNRWSPIVPIDREFEFLGGGTVRFSAFEEHVGAGSVGSKIYVLGGGFPAAVGGLVAFDAYDVTTGEWSSLPELTFDALYTKTVEVDGKLWCYASESADMQTFIYDPATESWTNGPDLPQELYGLEGAGPYHCTAFERDGRFCVLARFQEGSFFNYQAFAWDPTSGEWDENPFPPPPMCANRCSSMDNHLVAFGSEPTAGFDYMDQQEISDYSAGRTSKLYVLGPRATEWAEWRLPAVDARTLGTRIAAVRLG